MGYNLVLCLYYVFSRHVPTPILLGIDSIGIDGIAILVGINIGWYWLNTKQYQYQIIVMPTNTNTNQYRNTIDTNPPAQYRILNTNYSMPVLVLAHA